VHASAVRSFTSGRPGGPSSAARAWAPGP
jgi:hypothetical protein